MMRIEYIEAAAAETLIEDLTESSVTDLLYVKDLNGLARTECVAVYEDDKLLVIYAVVPGKNFFEPADVHLLVGKAYNKRYARLTWIVIRRIVEQYRGLRTLIDVTFGPGCRFARFLGFRPKGEPFDYAGRRFQLYEVYV